MMHCSVRELYMAAMNQRLLKDRPVCHPQMKKGYCREYKLEELRFYCENNLYQTGK